MGKTLDVTGLPDEVVRELEERIRACRHARAVQDPNARRTFGWWKGKLVVPDSFFEPMSEADLHGFEGDVSKFGGRA
jgi:hypothetical protein